MDSNQFDEKRAIGVLNSVFKCQNFRGDQLDIIKETMNKKDVFVVKPTGGGKSLLYQLPAVMSKGVTVVISPLKSLIADQIRKLDELGVCAKKLTPDTKSNEKQILDELTSSRNETKTKLLFMTPEKCMNHDGVEEMMDYLHTRGLLDRIAIDECHCVLDWGFDFRKDYSSLGRLKEKYVNTQFIALTATASPKATTKIIDCLKLDSPKIFRDSLLLENLKYTVVRKSRNSTKVRRALIKQLNSAEFKGKRGVIFCATKSKTDGLAKLLNQKKIKAISYHGDKKEDEIVEIWKQWTSDQPVIMVATTVFGMGVDDNRIRFVINFDLPHSLEQYYQQSGRAGRDGQLAESIIYYSYKDLSSLKYILCESGLNLEAKLEYLNEVVDYCEDRLTCRRKKLLSKLEDTAIDQCNPQSSEACDNCKNKKDLKHININKIGFNVAQLCSQQFGNVTLVELVTSGFDFKMLQENTGRFKTVYSVQDAIHSLLQKPEKVFEGTDDPDLKYILAKIEERAKMKGEEQIMEIVFQKLIGKGFLTDFYYGSKKSCVFAGPRDLVLDDLDLFLHFDNTKETSGDEPDESSSSGDDWDLDTSGQQDSIPTAIATCSSVPQNISSPVAGSSNSIQSNSGFQCPHCPTIVAVRANVRRHLRDFHGVQIPKGVHLTQPAKTFYDGSSGPWEQLSPDQKKLCEKRSNDIYMENIAKFPKRK